MLRFEKAQHIILTEYGNKKTFYIFKEETSAR